MKTDTKKNVVLFAVLLLAAGLAPAVYFEGAMNTQNLAVYTFSYRYGLIPRGFLGSWIDVFCSILGVPLSYSLCMKISALATLVWYMLLFLLYVVVLRKTPDAAMSAVRAMLMFFSVFAFTEFVTANNFGRSDEYLMVLSILAVLLLVAETAEWLLVPICGIACLIHTGFAFTNSGLILALLVYKWLSAEEKPRRRYFSAVFLGCFGIISVLFLRLEVFQTAVAPDVFARIESAAKALCLEGGNEENVSGLYSLLNSELLRIDVYESEAVWRGYNIREFPVFLVLFSPFILWLGAVFRRLFQSIPHNASRLRYLALVSGVLTIVPEFLLKVDYGRWVFCVIFYYCMVLLSVIAMDDKAVGSAVSGVHQWVVSHHLRIPMIACAFLFVPLRDVSICDFSLYVMRLLFRYYA